MNVSLQAATYGCEHLPGSFLFMFSLPVRYVQLQTIDILYVANKDFYMQISFIKKELGTHKRR